MGILPPSIALRRDAKTASAAPTRTTRSCAAVQLSNRSIRKLWHLSHGLSKMPEMLLQLRSAGRPQADRSAAVVLYLLDRPDLRLIWIFAVLLLSPPLPQQIPALVQILFYPLQPRAVRRVFRAGRRRLRFFAKFALLLNEPLNTLQDVLFVHGVLLPGEVPASVVSATAPDQNLACGYAWTCHSCGTH